MTDLYDRQRELHLNIPNTITIAGCGGIGARVAYESALTGVSTIYLFDPDTLEESNRNRLPFCQGSINLPKVEAVKNFIDALRPEATVVAIPEKLDNLFLHIQLTVSDFIIDCTDSPRAQFEIYNACLDRRTNYIRAGYDGTHITVTSVVSGWIKTNVEEEHYQIRPSWAVPAGIVALLAVAKMEKYPDQEVSLDISEIGIPVLKRRRKLTRACLVH